MQTRPHRSASPDGRPNRTRRRCCLGLAERGGHRIPFWQFTKYGLIVAAVTIAVSMPTFGCAVLSSRLSEWTM
jgi:hypothetical protein